MGIDYRVISIGAMASHPLWNESGEVRTGHSTTTLVSSGDCRILVDPSLPATALVARLNERSGLTPDQVTHVFLTSFEPERRRALSVFQGAQWLVHGPEQEAASAALGADLQDTQGSGDLELASNYERQLALLERCTEAPDKLAPGVDLFPLPGVTLGTCGLLLAQPAQTVLICGDAVPTWEHLSDGKVLPHCADLEQAQESFKEAVEIADVLVLGRDNAVVNPISMPVT